MNRIIFPKGKQKAFIDQVKTNLDSPSLRSLLQYGFKTNYSSLKNYYTERRLLPKDLFNDFCHLSKINPNEIQHQIKKSTWGQQKGGKIKISRYSPTQSKY
jgi:hypothetical protein